MSFSPIKTKTFEEVPSLKAQVVLFKANDDYDAIVKEKLPRDLIEYIHDFQNQADDLYNSIKAISFDQKLFEIPTKNIDEDAQYDFINCFFKLDNKGYLERDAFLQQELFEAVRNRNLTVVKDLLLEPKIDINAKDNHDRTPLSIAISNEDLSMIILLLNHADPDKVFTVHAKDLFFKHPKLSSIFEKTHQSRKKITPIVLASAHGDINAIEILLKKKSSLTKTVGPEAMGIMCLFIAIINENKDVVEIILDNLDGTDVEVLERIKVVRNKTAVLINDQIASIIDKKLKEFIPGFEFSNTIDSMTLAIQLENIDFIKKILKEGSVDINAVNTANERALGSAIDANKIEIAKFLIENGANYDNVDYLKLMENLEICEFIFQKNLDFDFLSILEFGIFFRGENAESIFRGFLQLVIKYGDNNVLDKFVDIHPVLFTAVTNEKEKYSKILLENGANPNIKDFDDQTVLMRLKSKLEEGNSIMIEPILKKFVQLILDYGKEVDITCPVIQEFLPTLPDEY